MATIIKLGLISLPCMLVNSVNNAEKRISFKQTHLKKGCLGDIGYKKYCKKCDMDLTNPEIAKKYHDKVLTDDEIREVKGFFDNQVIDVLGFTDIDINQKRIFFYATYYLLVDMSKQAKRNLQKNYLGFCEAIKDSKKTAIVRYTSRGTQHLGLMYFNDERLVLSLIPFNKAINQDIERLSEAVENLGITSTEVEPIKNEATKFISSCKFKGSISKVKNEMLDKFTEFMKAKDKVDLNVVVQGLTEKTENLFAIAK